MSNKNNNKKEFIIDNKKEFLVTYPNDYFGALDNNMIISFFNTPDWLWCISKETGHESGDIHDHFHVYLKYRGPREKGFRARGKDAQFIWDIKLNLQQNENVVTKFNSKTWPLNKNGEKITMAHPNIKFKGDKFDANCKNSFKMLEYVTKQIKTLDEEHWKIWSNFNWKEELENLRNKYEKKTKKTKTISEEEMEFTCWLRDQIRQNQHLSKIEIKRKIMDNDLWNHLFMSKYLNYNKLINDIFKTKPNAKPIPYWGIYYIPYKLKEYLDYLNNWFKLWDEGKQPKGSRPKALFMSGCGSSGKSSIIACLGTFSYWCTIWNMNNWEGSASFNFFDDYDGSEDYKGNQINSNWSLLKPWIGGQAVATISGKYREPISIINDKPCVFISNKPFEERFPHDARKYWKDCGATIIDLGDKKLNKPFNLNGINRKTIGGFAEWVEYDTRSTYYYNTYIKKDEKGKKPEIEQNIEENIEKNIEKNNVDEDVESIPELQPKFDWLPEPPSEITEENDTVDHILLEEVENDIPAANSNVLGRLLKRCNPFASDSGTSSNSNKKSRKNINELFKLH